MKDRDAIRQRIKDEEDFIYCPRLGNSVEQLLEKNPDGIDDVRMTKVLLMSEEEIEQIYESALQKLKSMIGL